MHSDRASDSTGFRHPVAWLFQDVRYTCHAKEDGSWDRTEWTDVKFKLGLALPNLPYMIDGDKSLTETNAILLYLGEKAGLCGKTAFDRAEVRYFTLREAGHHCALCVLCCAVPCA